MLIEGAANPAPEAPEANPAPEAETETVETLPESTTDEATDGSDESQPTDIADSDTSEGAKDDEERQAGMREADYRRKTMEVAEIRKGLEARQQKLDSVVSQGEAIVQALSAEFQADFAHIDWGKLAAEDPAEYVRQQHALSSRQQKLQAAIYRLNEAKQVQAATSAEVTQERLKSEQTRLLESLPEWKDAKRYASESAEISEYLTKAGYAPDEVSGVTDHRAVILARKAMLYDRMVAKAPKPLPVSKAPPPVPKAPTKATATKNWTEMTDKEFAEYRRRQIAQRRP